jgi:hypothetical protein
MTTKYEVLYSDDGVHWKVWDIFPSVLEAEAERTRASNLYSPKFKITKVTRRDLA